ncbi:MAG: AI-2E family transporter [Pseudomonadota bacterium]|nr:AI-2E family transporter [Pseudomonadota bacterium]
MNETESTDSLDREHSLDQVRAYLGRLPWWAWGASILSLFAVVYFLGPVLDPFAAAFILAYLFRPFVERIAGWGVPRSLAVFIVFAAVILAVSGAVLILIPPLQEQISRLIAVVPAIFSWIQDTALPWISNVFSIDVSRVDIQSFASVIQRNLSEAGTAAGFVARYLTSSGLALVGLVAKLSLIPIVAFYLMRDWKRVLESFSRLVPRPLLEPTKEFFRETDDMLAAFLRGQLSVMIALGLIYGVGLWVAGVEFALVIGFFAGLVSFVPYLGFAVGIGAALISALFTGAEPLTYLYIVIVFGIGQILEGSVITPNLVGDRIGLHPVVVIFAVLAGAQLFGFAGVMLALPVSAVLAVFFRHLGDIYMRSELYENP